MNQDAFFLKSGDTQLYAAFFSPDSEPEKVFLFCHPLFEEKKASHRILVELARALAAENCASLMLDLSSCGDSEGQTKDFVPAKWLADIQSEIDYLNERFNHPEIVFLGIRFGATLAINSALKNDNIKNLILIDPVIHGQAYLDEVLQQKYIREMMTFGEAKSDVDAMTAELEKNGQLDIDGVMISADFFNAVKEINVDKADLKSLEKILLIQQSPKESLLSVYDALKKNCEIYNIKLDLSLLKVPPFWKAVDMAESEKICIEILQWKNQ